MRSERRELIDGYLEKRLKNTALGGLSYRKGA